MKFITKILLINFTGVVFCGIIGVYGILTDNILMGVVNSILAMINLALALFNIILNNKINDAKEYYNET